MRVGKETRKRRQKSGKEISGKVEREKERHLNNRQNGSWPNYYVCFEATCLLRVIYRQSESTNTRIQCFFRTLTERYNVTHTHTHTHTHTQAHRQTHTLTQAHARIHTNKQTQAHTHTHTHIQKQKLTIIGIFFSQSLTCHVVNIVTLFSIDANYIYRYKACAKVSSEKLVFNYIFSLKL